MQDILALFIPILFLGGVFTLVGMKIRYSHMQDNHLGAGQREVEYLTDTVDNLRAEVELLRDEFGKLDERMDFTERLLERPKTEEPRDQDVAPSG